MIILTRNYSRFHDLTTDTPFAPVLDPKSGCWIGMAEVGEDKAKEFDGRAGFEVYDSDADAFARTASEPVEAPPSATGDPLKDAAKGAGKTAPEPPAPPSS